MIVIKTGFDHIPDSCDSCQWYESRPHPYKGWTDICELMGRSLDDDQPEEWIYGGDDRPEACPLIDVPNKGEWTGDYDGYADGEPVCDMWCCSVCGEYFDEWNDKPEWNFCPNCGADMRIKKV